MFSRCPKISLMPLSRLDATNVRRLSELPQLHCVHIRNGIRARPLPIHHNKLSRCSSISEPILAMHRPY